jgi:uncharacterized repeat protein (TIGR01451 family)
MNKVLSTVSKRALSAVAVLAILVGSAPTAFAAFGPDRTVKPWTPQENGFQYVTFNSYTGVPKGIGDERDFFRGVSAGRDSVWSDPVANIAPDSEIQAKIYIHNNADPLLNDKAGNPGVARNVTVRVVLPTGIKQTHQMTAYIKADNANPKQIFDTLDITGANNGLFELAPVAGSVKLHLQNGTATTFTAAQEAALFSATGANIGDQKGCFEFVREITFRLKAKTPKYNVSKTVRLDGTGPGNWKEEITAKPGQTVEWNIEFRNVGKTTLKDMLIVDNIPAGVTIVPGSVRLFNMSNPNGKVLSANAVQANGRQININIGDYAPNANAGVTFKTKVDTDDKLKCGTTVIVNEAYANPKGYGAVRDTAKLSVNGKVCATPEKPKTLVNTGFGSVAGIFTGTTLAAAGAYNIVLRRRSL